MKRSPQERKAFVAAQANRMRHEMTPSMLPERFWQKVELIIDNTLACWNWTACKRGGYGAFDFNGRLLAAHRLVYEALVGPIPDGLTIDHLCRNRSCVNPLHLEPVTSAENTRRWAVTITHCKDGHELSGDNVWTRYSNDGQTRRVCRECARTKTRQWRAERAANRPELTHEDRSHLTKIGWQTRRRLYGERGRL